MFLVSTKIKTQAYLPQRLVSHLLNLSKVRHLCTEEATQHILNSTNVRLYCTVEASSDDTDQNASFKSTKRKAKPSVSPEIVNYLSKHNPSLNVESIPDKYLVKSKSAKTLYLANPETAEQIAKVLKPHIEKCKAQVIECHPGLGLLTAFLLEMKISKLYLHEPDPVFHENLSKIYSSKKVNIFNNDIVQVPKYNFAKKKIDLMLDYVKPTNWENKCSFQIIASLNNQDFLRYILRNFTNQDGMLSYGRPMMYLFITPTTYQKLIAGPHQPWNLYKPLAVLFQIIFHIDLLMTLDRNVFLPWPTMSAASEKSNSKGKAGSSKENPMYLIKVEGKRDVYQKLGQHNTHRVKALQKFVIHAIGRKKQRVIPTIEQWVPGFGPHLIARNINVYTLFNELTPDEILDIFCSIHHIPGYEEFDIPPSSPDGVVDETKEKRIDTSIDIFLDEEDEEELDDGLTGTR